MLSHLYFVFCALSAPLVFCLPAALPDIPDLVERADISFNCDCIDHWFKHGRFWMRASSTTGCVSLETISKKVYALNALPKPDYVSNNYPNLICSLIQNKCQWTYSPLDYLSDATSSDSDAEVLATGQQSSPACEKLDDVRDLLAPVLPFAEGPATPEELELADQDDKASIEEDSDSDDEPGEAEDSESDDDGDSHDDGESDSDEDRDSDDGDEGTDGQPTTAATS